MSSENLSYYRRRANSERKAAKLAERADIAEIHEALARLYDAMSEGEEQPSTVGRATHPGKTFQAQVIFSCREGQVWASWPWTDAAVNLGPYDAVVEMMRDFLAQCALGKRLCPRSASND